MFTRGRQSLQMWDVRVAIDFMELFLQTRWLWPNHALQRTRRGRRGCSRGVPCAGSLSLGR
jgi:hypothetical protein